MSDDPFASALALIQRQQRLEDLSASPPPKRARGAAGLWNGAGGAPSTPLAPLRASASVGADDMARRLSQLRSSTSAQNFAQAASTTLARMLLGASSHTRLGVLEPAIASLQSSGEFDRRSFAAALLSGGSGGGRRPALADVWRLHETGVLPLEHFVSGAAAAEGAAAFAAEAQQLCRDTTAGGDPQLDTLRLLLRALMALPGNEGARLLRAMSAQTAGCVELRMELLRAAAAVRDAHPRTASAVEAHELLSLLTCGAHGGVAEALPFLSSQDWPLPVGAQAQLMVALVQQFSVMALVDGVERAVRRREADWSFLAALIPWATGPMATEASKAAALAEGLFVLSKTLFLDAVGASDEATVSAAIVLLRLVCARPHPNPTVATYRERFKATFVDSLSQPTIPRKELRVLLRVLETQVPADDDHDSLRAQIDVLPRTHPSCRENIEDYLQLAKTRCVDLKPASARAAKGPSAASSAQTHVEVRGYIRDFEGSGIVPARIPEQFFFKKAWWKQAVVPILLRPQSSEAPKCKVQREFIERLREANKELMPSDALARFDEACEFVGSGSKPQSGKLGSVLSALVKKASAGDLQLAAQFMQLETVLAAATRPVQLLLSQQSQQQRSQQHSTTADLLLDGFCSLYKHVLQCDASEEEQLRAMLSFISAAHHGLGLAHERLEVAVRGGVELTAHQCNSYALLLAAESVSTGSAAFAARVIGAAVPMGSLQRTTTKMRLGAAYVASLMALFPSSQTHAHEAELLPRASILEPLVWLHTRWAYACRAAPALHDAALGARWEHCCAALSAQGVHCVRPRLQEWLPIELVVDPASDIMSQVDRSAFLRAEVRAAAETESLGKFEVCKQLLGAVLDRAPGPAGSELLLLLLLQELASTAAADPALDGRKWALDVGSSRLAAAANEAERAQTRGKFLSVLLLLSPAAVWTPPPATTAHSEESLQQIWSSIQEHKLGPWSEALCQHFIRGVLPQANASADSLRVLRGFLLRTPALNTSLMLYRDSVFEISKAAVGAALFGGLFGDSLRQLDIAGACLADAASHATQLLAREADVSAEQMADALLACSLAVISEAEGGGGAGQEAAAESAAAVVAAAARQCAGFDALFAERAASWLGVRVAEEAVAAACRLLLQCCRSQ